MAAIGSITPRIQEISGVANSIAAAAEQQGAETHEIVRNVGRAATCTAALTMNIAGVAGAAASQVLSAASALSRQSQHLAEGGRHFLATVRAA